MRVVALAAVAVMAGCSAPTSTPFDEPLFMHVHGVGYLPGQIFVATHHGLIVGNESKGKWSWEYTGPERFDYMGFVQDAVNPEVFYSSGHPDDPRAYGGVNLGLRRSSDMGASWEQRSLKGATDFHFLSSIPGVEGGFLGVVPGKILESRDGGLTWSNHTIPATQYPFDVAATTGKTYVASGDGLKAGRLGESANWTKVNESGYGPFYTIAAAPDGRVLFAGTGDGRTGTTYRSNDGGDSWAPVSHRELREAGAAAQFAFDDADPGHVVAGTAAGTILESHDDGASWKTIRQS